MQQSCFPIDKGCHSTVCLRSRTRKVKLILRFRLSPAYPHHLCFALAVLNLYSNNLSLLAAHPGIYFHTTLLIINYTWLTGNSCRQVVIQIESKMPYPILSSFADTCPQYIYVSSILSMTPRLNLYVFTEGRLRNKLTEPVSDAEFPVLEP